MQIRSVYHRIFWTWVMFYLRVFKISFFWFLSFLGILSLLFLAIFPDLEMLQFWTVNYICQVCKSYFYFGHVRNFGQHFYLSVLVNSESVLLLTFVKYMLHSHCPQNCIALYFLLVKNPCFVTKNCSKSSYICVFILFKKQHNWF